MDITIEKVTPAKARSWLEKHNVNNRPLSANWVSRLAAEMSAGRWEATGDTIKFSKNGLLLDGQHRLAAIAASGKTCTIGVVRGLESRVFDVLDQGKGRTLADMFAMAGEASYSQLSSVVAWHYRYVHGMSRKHRPTKRQLVSHLESRPYLRRTPEKKLRGGGFRSWGMWLALYAEARETVDADLAHEFFTQVWSGCGDAFQAGEEKNPIRVLRRQVERNWTLTKKAPADIVGQWVIKAFNHWMSGREVKLIRWASSEGDIRFEGGK